MRSLRGLLDHRLGDAERVDAVVDRLLGLVDRQLAHLGRGLGLHARDQACRPAAGRTVQSGQEAADQIGERVPRARRTP